MAGMRKRLENLEPSVIGGVSGIFLVAVIWPVLSVFGVHAFWEQLVAAVVAGVLIRLVVIAVRRRSATRDVHPSADT